MNTFTLALCIGSFVYWVISHLDIFCFLRDRFSHFSIAELYKLHLLPLNESYSHPLTYRPGSITNRCWWGCCLKSTWININCQWAWNFILLSSKIIFQMVIRCGWTWHIIAHVWLHYVNTVRRNILYFRCMQSWKARCKVHVLNTHFLKTLMVVRLLKTNSIVDHNPHAITESTFLE